LFIDGSTFPTCNLIRFLCSCGIKLSIDGSKISFIQFTSIFLPLGSGLIVLAEMFRVFRGGNPAYLTAYITKWLVSSLVSLRIIAIYHLVFMFMHLMLHCIDLLTPVWIRSQILGPPTPVHISVWILSWMESVCEVKCALVAHSVHLGLEYLVRSVVDGRNNLLVVGLDGCVHAWIRHHHVFKLLFGHFIFELHWSLLGSKNPFRFRRFGREVWKSRLNRFIF